MANKIWDSFTNIFRTSNGRRGAIAFVFSTIIIGEVFVPMIPPQWKAISVYVMVTVAILEFVPFEKLGINNPLLQKLSVIGITSLVMLPATFFSWNAVYDYFVVRNAPQISPYIKQNSIHVNNFLIPYQYKTVLEFGARTTDERINIDFETLNNWDKVYVEGWFDTPNNKDITQSNKSIFDQTFDMGGAQTVGIQPSFTIIPPKFSLNYIDVIRVNNVKSIYISVLSNEPLKFKHIEFAGVKFLQIGNKLIPENKQ